MADSVKLHEVVWHYLVGGGKNVAINLSYRKWKNGGNIEHEDVTQWMFFYFDTYVSNCEAANWTLIFTIFNTQFVMRASCTTMVPHHSSASNGWSNQWSCVWKTSIPRKEFTEWRITYLGKANNQRRKGFTKQSNTCTQLGLVRRAGL